MKPSPGIFTLIASAIFSLNSQSAEVPVTFDLAVDATGVAVQFDVSADQPIESIGIPLFTGTSDHRVESATIESGTHRFVVYSSTGDPISPSGEISVEFKPTIPMVDGAISIGNVTASDANGVVVTAQPNAYPVLVQSAKNHQSFEAGSSILFPQLAVDLDGATKSLVLDIDNQEAGSTQVAPFALNWGPVALGSYALNLTATDDQDQTVSFDLGTFQAYNLSDVSDFGSFSDTHFGDEKDDPLAAFDTDPFGSGFANGLAFFLDQNPHSLNSEALPKVHLEITEQGTKLVIQFTRRSDLAGLTWNPQSSSDLAIFNELIPSSLVETDQEDGTHAVVLRIPVDPETLISQFVNIAVSAPTP